MATAAQNYASNCQTAEAAKPAAFQVNGHNVAVVCADGTLMIYSYTLNTDQAKSLRQWIKQNFVDEV